MINIETLRDNPNLIREGLDKRGENTASIDEIIHLDKQWRAKVFEADTLRSHRNSVNKEIGNTKPIPATLISEMRDVSTRIKEIENRAKSLEKQVEELLLTIPNIPDDDVPIGSGEENNLVIKSPDKLPSFSFTPLSHWEIGEKLQIIDLQRGAKIAGSRFYVLKGQGAVLQRALVSWMLDLHIQHGYEELYLPYLVTRDTATGSGQLPKFDSTMYHDNEDDLWMIPTAEVPITSMHRDEILNPKNLPLHYVAHTPCFRREKAAAGRDTRGIKRVHQFEKVEMYKLVEPENSPQALAELVSNAESICAQLQIPYRVIELCAGELGAASAKSFDLEMWAPGSQEWLEVSSCSNCRDFQARRSNIRYRPAPKARTKFIHTLNGSGLALPRVMISIIENFQQPDGSIIIPDVLKPYTNFDKIKPKQG